MTDEELYFHQLETVHQIKMKSQHYQTLYQLTNHGKKKEKHKQNIQFMQDVITLAYEEYGWSQ